MSEIVRLYRYRSLLFSMRAVSAVKLMATLEISPATVKRDIAKSRDQLRMPSEFDHELGGYARLMNLVARQLVKSAGVSGYGVFAHLLGCRRSSFSASEGR